jgi:hypothetical protein
MQDILNKENYMEKIVLIKQETLCYVNAKLEEGWTVKMIIPINQPVSNGSASWGKEGIYGAYVVLEKKADL